MQSRGLLLGIPAALSPLTVRALVAGLVLALAAGTVAGAPARAARDPDPGGRGAWSGALPPPPGTTTLVSFRVGGRPNSGPAGGGPSAEPSISANGRYVAFTSRAPDLVAGDTNNALDVFVLDRRNGAMIRLPLPGGAPVPPNGAASQPSISADGNVVAFSYQPASTATTGAAVGSIVLAWDRRTGETEVVSRNEKGGAARFSTAPSTSADGRYIAYVSEDVSIAGNDGNEAPDVFRYDRRTGATVMVSVRAAVAGVAAGAANGTSVEPSISGDGNVIAFASTASNLVPNEPAAGGGFQVFARDLAAGVTERISRPADGGQLTGIAEDPSISADGTKVAFASTADNLGGGAPSTYDVFVRDRTAGTTTLVSVGGDGAGAVGVSGQASISADGRVVAFISTAKNLLAAGPAIRLAAIAPAVATEVYARDIVRGETILVSAGPGGGPANNRSLTPAVNGDGRYIAFASGNGPMIAAGDDNKLSDVYLRDLPPQPALTPAVLDLGARPVGIDAPPGAATLTNGGWGPLRVTGASVAGGAAGDFPLVFDGCKDRTLYRGDACTVTVGFRPTAEGTRTSTLEVADAYTGSPRTARLRGAGSLAVLELDPPLGPPGIVTVATGEGFPANTDLRLAWDRGIDPRLPVVRTDAQGRFRVQVLVFHNDLTGTRELVATPVNPAAFPPVQAEMLVLPASMRPPALDLMRIVGIPFPLVIRG